MTRFDDLPPFDDDGGPIAEVGSWAMEKYRRVWYYNQIFSMGMKNRFHQRIYIDLFAGSGLSRIQGTDRIVPGSPLLALMVNDPYTKYIFVEKEKALLEALRERTARVAPGADVDFHEGDVNADIHEIVARIPPFSRENTQLSFSFVDPFSVDLDFRTIERLSRDRNIDFLILLALGMDANRNMAVYLEDHHSRIERFLGDANWRERWAKAQELGMRFTYFLATSYIAAMDRIGYPGTTSEGMYQVRSDTKNLGLYYLAFFSRHPLGHRFWREVLHYTDDQLPLL